MNLTAGSGGILKTIGRSLSRATDFWGVFTIGGNEACAI